MVLFLLGQSIVIVGAVVVSYVRTCVSIARLQVQGEYCVSGLDEMKTNQTGLANKVDGISRHVAALEAIHIACPYVRKESGKGDGI